MWGQKRRIRLLKPIPIDPEKAKFRHWGWPKSKTVFDVGDVLFWRDMPDGSSIMPFELAGSGFELVFNPVEGVDFEFI